MPYSDPQQQREAQAAWYKKNIELTHSRTKKWREENPEFGISAGNLRKKMSKLIKEADKCELLCVMCHRMEHHKRTTELLK